MQRGRERERERENLIDSLQEVTPLCTYCNQRTNCPANAHMISGPSISTKHIKPDYKWSSNS